MATSKISLKLLVDTKGCRVLFAEVGKDFVDLLFSLLSLPIGTVIRLLTKRSMVGCLGNLYESVENLSDTYMQPNLHKDSLLNPKTSCAVGVPLLLTNETSEEKMVYRCGNYHNHHYWSDNPQAICPDCNDSMSTQSTYVASNSVQKTEPVGVRSDCTTSASPMMALRRGAIRRGAIRRARMRGALACAPLPIQPVEGGVPLLLTNETSEEKMVYRCADPYNHQYWSDNPQAICPGCHRSMSTKNKFVAPKSVQTTEPVEGGYVKGGVVTYMVMDNLEVKPMSTISGITLINKFNVKDLSGLQERMVDFTFDEAQKLLKSSLQSDMVLTSVYLGKVKSEA